MLNDLGYEVTFGEAYRPKEMAAIYKAQGVGIDNSLHSMRLAFDLNLFMDGRFLQTKDEYEEAGKIWQSYSCQEYECIWGGIFSDSDHFSMEHNGVK